MDTTMKEYILAIITLDKEKVITGGCPVFIADNKDQQYRMGIYLASILDGVVHDLENDVLFICKH